MQWSGLIMMICEVGILVTQLLNPGRFFYPQAILAAGMAVVGLFHLVRFWNTD